VLAEVGYQIASSHISDSFPAVHPVHSIYWIRFHKMEDHFISLLHFCEILSLVAVLCVLRKVTEYFDTIIMKQEEISINRNQAIYP
jgi:hypothetical protein